MAPIWMQHLRLSFGGTLGTPVVESWNCNVRFVDISSDFYSPDRPQLVDRAAAVWPIIGDWLHGGESQVSSAAHLTFLKLNAVLPNGHQRDDDTVLHEAAAIAGGTDQASIWSNTYALTHRTARKRGRGAAGRIFPPAIAAVPPTPGDPYIQAITANTMATAWANCLSRLNFALSGEFDGIPVAFRASVVSPGDSVKGTAAVYEPITDVVCDRVPDVQHRRTKSVPRSEGFEYHVTSHA